MSLMLKQLNSAEKPVQPIEVMNRLFGRFIAFWGNKFTDAFSNVETDDMKAIWAEELGGYSIREINQGVAAARSMKWPPTLPEFLAACRPPIDPTSAYYEAIANMALREKQEIPEYSHPAIYWAAASIGQWDMRNTAPKYILSRWSAVLDRELAKAHWDAVPPPPPRLEAPAGHAPSPEIAAQLRELTARFRGPMEKAKEQQ